MRGFKDVVAFVLLLLIVIAIITFALPIYLKSGQESTRTVKQVSKPMETYLKESFTIFDVKYLSDTNHTCILIKNDGEKDIEHFIVVINSTRYDMNEIYVTSLCDCKAGALMNRLPKQSCGYFLIPGQLPKGTHIYIQSDYSYDSYVIV